MTQNPEKLPTQRVRVRLIPLGNRIKYRLVGTVFCTRQGGLLPNSRTYASDDLLWVQVFGSAVRVRRFIHRNRIQTRVLALTELGYDFCDRVR